VIPDAHKTDLRSKDVRELPWPILATVLFEMSDEDLNRLTAAPAEHFGACSTAC
jgi:hypothetical protein